MSKYGLQRRDKYEEIVDYLEHGQEKIRYPNRRAKQMRESPYLTQLDGEGMMDMHVQQLNAMKEQQKEHAIRKIAASSASWGSPSSRDCRGYSNTPP